MQNPSTTDIKNQSKHLQQVTEGVTESADHLTSELGKKAKMAAQNTADSASQYYDQASTWLEQNYGKTLGIVGLVAASGIIGFFIGRNRNTFDKING